MKIFPISILTLFFCGQALWGANPAHWVQSLHGEDYGQRRSSLNALESHIARASNPSADAGKRMELERELLGYVSDPRLPELTRAYVLRLIPAIAGSATRQQMLNLLLDAGTSAMLANDAAGVLAILDDSSVADVLLEALPAASGQGREWMLSVLAQRADPSAADALINLLNRNSLSLDDRLIQTLGAIGGDASGAFLFERWEQSQGRERVVLARALLHSGAAKESMLHKLATQSDTPELRVGSLLQWAVLNEAEALGFLQTQVEKQDPHISELVGAQLNAGGVASWDWITSQRGQLSDAAMIVVLQRVMELQRRDLEPWVIQCLEGASAQVELAAVRCLGVIGSSASIDALVARMRSRSTKLASTAFHSLASFQDASFDERLHVVVKQPQDVNYLSYLDLYSVRNSEGTVDFFNEKFSKDSPRGEELAIVLRALERVGTVESVKLMLAQVLVESDAAVLRNLQIAIKRLVIRLEQPDRLWKESFEPALSSEPSQMARVLPLLDAISSSEVLKVCIRHADGRNALLAGAAEQALIRWRRLEVCDYWLSVLTKVGAQQAQQQKAVRMITTTLRSDSLLDSNDAVIAKLVELFVATEIPELRESLLSVVQGFEESQQGLFYRNMRRYLSVEQYRERIDAFRPKG